MNEINDIITILTKLPGVGKKSAQRLSYFLLKNKHIALEISHIIEDVISNINFCSICGNFTTKDVCSICEDYSRDQSMLCVVEEPKDLLAIEETGCYKGLYHILMGSINPLDGVNPDKLKINELVERIKKGNFSEVLIATNPTIEGEATFLYLNNILSKFNIKRSRIATGIPMGGSLEYSDSLTLGKAISSKHYL
ncbi:MAG: recombination protein RecR [Spirochaetes bacterium GWD1_27_9]|nr:MAG: recombination protein RecR [Spirochaetes bacterium GWB1_27_13]OHD43971.1 MAG: recombination protein RecR [Spirochaetes bacterium GWD1_27_9]